MADTEFLALIFCSNETVIESQLMKNSSQNLPQQWDAPEQEFCCDETHNNAEHCE